MSTKETTTNEANAVEETVPFRDREIDPDELIPMVLELTTYEDRFSAETPPAKAEKSYFEKRKPVQIRYQRLLALLNAYGILPDLDRKHPAYSFINGDFLDRGPKIDNAAMELQLRECLKELNVDEILATHPLGFRFLQYNHQEFSAGLFHYLIGLRNADNYFYGYLAMGGGISRAARVVSELRNQYPFPQIAILHETLMLYIHRDKVKHYTVGELIDKYGYPSITDEELSELDVKWM